MSSTFTCEHCQEVCTCNPRLKGNQRYCGNKDCQRARKSKWQRDKMASDPAYAARQREAVRHWRKQKPGHKYQRSYRETHPEYVSRNRELQKKRNASVKSTKESEKIVKMDTLSANSMPVNGIYALLRISPENESKIVKMDALLVQLQAVEVPGGKAGAPGL